MRENPITGYLDRLYQNEQKVRIAVKHPGILEVPEGGDVEKLPLSHFQGLIRKKGWEEISKALINLKVWMKKSNPKISKWADDTQEKLAKWVETQREKTPEFGD